MCIPGHNMFVSLGETCYMRVMLLKCVKVIGINCWISVLVTSA